MRIHRMLEITTLLLNRGSLTARELSERFEVSVRTIYRDVEALSGAGVPVYMTRGSGGGISLMENFTLDKTLLSEAESESLLLALGSLKAARYPDLDAVLEKMGAVFKGGAAADWLQIDPVRWGSSPNEHNKFSDIKRAIVQRRVLSFSYVNAQGERSARTAEPVQLIFNTGNWYLFAFCRLRGEYRFFRVSRVKDVSLSDEIFAPREIPHYDEGAYSAAGRLTPLVLRFGPRTLNRLYDYFDDSLITKVGESFEVRVSMPVDEGMFGYLLSYGDALEVVEPAWVREGLVARMRSALEQYHNG